MSGTDLSALVGAVTALVVSITTLIKLFRHTSSVHDAPIITASESASAQPSPPA